MRVPRLYLPLALAAEGEYALPEEAARHALRVLRLKQGAPIVVFNGEGGEYAAIIATIRQNEVLVRTTTFRAREVESKLVIDLAQGISRGERMDYTIQKAVELGVSAIRPVFTDRCMVQLRGERLLRRQQHWQAVAASACEQCGRNRIPPVHAPLQFGELLQAPGKGLRILLAPGASETLSDIHPRRATAPITLLIGPEGGLTDAERNQAAAAGFRAVRLGPRVLRTETAAIAAIAAMQCLWGDLLRPT